MVVIQIYQIYQMPLYGGQTGPKGFD